jgi:hypothetical protein
MSDRINVLPADGKPNAPVVRPRIPPSRRPQAQAQVQVQVSPEAVAWAAKMFRVRGWKSNTAKNKALKADLDGVAANLLQPDGPDSAAALTAEKLDPGSEFKTYMKCLAAYEQAPDPKAAALLRTAAEIYIAHYDTHSTSQKKQKRTLRKFQACQKTIADLDLKAKIQDIGDPPWNSTTAMEAATVKAEADFSTLPLGGQKAETLDGKGVNPTFWVNKASDDPAKPAKTYLFKPATAKQDRTGVPPGGEPAREALTGRAADILNGMTGIDFKVPDTHIVKVERKRFEGVPLAASVVDRDGDGPLVGSLQQFAPSKGEMRDNPPSLSRAVSPERCQEMAILDIVTMNVDRHGGNFMIDGDEKGADIVPIDNGLSFPDSPIDLSRMSTSHNALLRLPGSHEPFTPEMLKKIAKIDPAALKVALKSEVGDIEAVHSSAKLKVADAALEQSRRSAMFLKLAAPTLTPAAVQVALGQNADSLFDTTLDDRAFAVQAQTIIATIAQQQNDLAAFFQMSLSEYLLLEKECESLGWDTRDLSPQQAMAVFKSGTQKPAAPRQPADNAAPTVQEKTEMQIAFPLVRVTDKWATANVADWRKLAVIGNGAAVKAAIAAAASKTNDVTFKETVLKVPSRALKLLELQAAADAVPPVTAAAGDARMMDNKCTLIKSLATILPGPMQAQVIQRADTLRAGDHMDVLDRFRDQVAGAARSALLKDIEALTVKAGQIADANLKNQSLAELQDAEKLIRKEMDLMKAKELVDGVRQRT